MEADTIASIFVGLSTLVLASVSLLILRRTQNINERLLKIEEVRNVSEMRIVDNEVYFYNDVCYFRFDNCGGVPAFLEKMDLKDHSLTIGLNPLEESLQDTPRVDLILPPTVFDVGFPTNGKRMNESSVLTMTVRYRLVDDERCIPSHVQFKLSFKEKKNYGLMVFSAEKMDDRLIASIDEEQEKKKD
ncbi:MAG: hypothetical protein FWD37_00520 [Methanomassiliicoccaceae archaeon]|nr:hypothetical protein [Methanomassiliicoccaceae archaeon]